MLEHGDENQAVNRALCNDAIVGLNSYVRELCERWLKTMLRESPREEM